MFLWLEYVVFLATCNSYRCLGEMVHVKYVKIGQSLPVYVKQLEKHQRILLNFQLGSNLAKLVDSKEFSPSSGNPV